MRRRLSGVVRWVRFVIVRLNLASCWRATDVYFDVQLSFHIDFRRVAEFALTQRFTPLTPARASYMVSTKIFSGQRNGEL